MKQLPTCCAAISFPTGRLSSVLQLQTEKEMDNSSASTNLSSLIKICYLLIILNCIIMILREFYSSFLYALRSISCRWRDWTGENSIRADEVAACKLYKCTDRNVREKLTPAVGMLSEKSEAQDNNVSAGTFSQIPSSSKVSGVMEVTVEEVAVVMGKLGTVYDPLGDKLQEKLGSKDIAALFEEQEPSIEEVEEAFGMFDKNNDGFIDPKELRKVLCTLCFTEVSEADCRRMIKAYDDNGDGLIDFNEFVRLLANSFS